MATFYSGFRPGDGQHSTELISLLKESHWELMNMHAGDDMQKKLHSTLFLFHVKAVLKENRLVKPASSTWIGSITVAGEVLQTLFTAMGQHLSEFT